MVVMMTMMMVCNRCFPFLPLLLAATLPLLCAVQAEWFRDDSKAAGFQRLLGRRRLKYGGAAVADLDGDGWPDLLFGHHDDRNTDLYFNNRDGTFVKSPWGVWNDTHALTPFRFSAWQRSMYFLLSPGGSYGEIPRPPAVFVVTPDRAVVNVSRTSGLRSDIGRGRSAVFLNLRRGEYRFAQGVLTNAPLYKDRNVVNQFAFEATSANRFRRRKIPGFARNINSFGTVADVDNDGFVELLSWNQLTISRVVGNFVVRDITEAVWPRDLLRDGVVAIAEFDYDNDGRWDLYVARTNTADLSYVNGEVRDYLLRNVGGGRYKDVTKQAKIPAHADSRGVTVGDFNNDGWMDVIVTRYYKPDLILLNNRDGTFYTRSARFHRNPGTRGDMATAVDYDRDGRLDVVLSEGDHFNKQYGGYYRLLRNIGRVGNYLLVRVGNAPKRKAMSLHAVVKVEAGSLSMMRRVGTPGTAVSNSYIELVHFGLGPYKRAQKVSVRWVDGSTLTRFNVKSGSTLDFGVF